MQATDLATRRASDPGYLVPAVSLVLLLLLTLAVVAGMTAGIDRALLMLFRTPGDVGLPLGGAWWAETQRDFTAMGSNGVSCLVVVGAAACLAGAGRRRDAVYLLGCFGVTLLVVALAKHGFARARPELVPHVAQVFTTSFPSSLAAISAACCYGAAVLVAGGRGGAFRLVAWCFAAGVVLTIGVSRVYLGVHWPSDVVAGWALGVTSAAALQVLCRPGIGRSRGHGHP